MADRLIPMMQCTSTFPVEREIDNVCTKHCLFFFITETTYLRVMHGTVFVLQGFVDEVGGWFEVLAEVKAVRVFSRDAEVNTSVSVKALVSDAALLGVCCVQDVSDAQVM